MAKAVAKVFVTIGTEIAVNVLFTRRDDFINAATPFQPRFLKIFPKCRRATVQHATPVAANDSHRRIRLLGFG